MLVVRPVEHLDVTQCVQIRVDSLGSLVIGRPPPYPGFSEDQEAVIHRDIDSSPHVHHLKVVDPEDEHEIIAYGKWEVYERGRPDLEELSHPMEESAKAVDKFGRLREVAHDYFCTRNGEKGKHPHLRESICILTQEFRSSWSKTKSWPCLSQQANTGNEVLVACWYNGGLSYRKRQVYRVIYRPLNKDGACTNIMASRSLTQCSSIWLTMDLMGSKR